MDCRHSKPYNQITELAHAIANHMLKKYFRKSLFSTLSVSILGALFGASPHAFAQSDGQVSFADIGVCLPGLIDVPELLRITPDGSLDEQEIQIQGDEIEATDDSLIVINGNAWIIQGNRGVFADQITYNQEDYQATATGNVRFYMPNGDEITAESMNLEVDTFIGDAEQAGIKIVDQNPNFLNRRGENFEEDYSIFAPFRNRGSNLSSTAGDAKSKKYYQRARARGESMQFEGKDFEVLQNVVMTTCPEGHEDVTLSARELELDHATGTGTAKSMVVRLKNVPVFYFPSVSFPINDERKTGFLFPSFGKEEESGFILNLPYYINIAPNMDATIIPRILTERGFQLYSEFRYLGENSKGTIKAEFLPDDDVFNGQDRHAFGFDHRQSFAGDWNAEVDLQDVSDTQYLRDFTNNVDIVASSFVPQRARLFRNGEYIKFNARVQSVESVNDAINIAALPYDLLPEINLSLKPRKFGIFEAGVQAEYTRFEHDSSDRIAGSRTILTPSVTAPFEKIFGYLKPKVSLYNISYSLSNQGEGVSDSSPSASVPVFSVDSSLVFERRLLESGRTSYLQTLEPRLFYVNIPVERDQDAFPVFGTSESVANSFGHFFRENRFFGNDRVGDTEQITLGLSSRIINDDTGEQRLNLSVGQVVYLADREIRLDPAAEPDTSSRSDFIAELTANLNEDWSLTGFSLWDADENNLQTIRLSADYFNSSRRNASISYTERRDFSEQINLDFTAPLSRQWQLGVNTAYSIKDSELRSSSVNLGYDGCCWAVRIGTQRYLDGMGEYKNRILFTLELDNLGKIQSSLQPSD